MALREHVLDGGCFVRGVDLEGLAIPQPAWFVGVDRERPPPRFHRVAGDVVAVTVHLLPELGVVGHVSRGDAIHGSGSGVVGQSFGGRSGVEGEVVVGVDHPEGLAVDVLGE
eukprot:9422169-Pyramimonas_sp.AAC.1